MPSTYTESLRLEEQGTGENENTWGVKLNAGFDFVDKAIAGHVAVSLGSGGVVILTAFNATEDQARYRILEFTGTLTENAIVQLPEVSKEYIIWDSTTRNNFSLTLRLGTAGNTVAIPEIASSLSVSVATDGTNWRGNVGVLATTALFGSVRFATNAEAQAGLSGATVLSPASLQTVTATTTRSGVIELATQAEVDAGTDPARAVTPATLVARTATETRVGVIELATQAEVNAGADATRAVTSATLAGRTATETRAGVIELATQAEVDALTDTTRAVTPGTLGDFAITDYTVATAAPTSGDGANGDFWFQYE